MSEQATALGVTRVAPVSAPTVYFVRVNDVVPPDGTEIIRVPGVKCQGGLFVVPENALTVFERVVRETGGTTDVRRAGPPVPAAPSVESFLNVDRLQSKALELIRRTPFQAEGIRLGCLRDGFALHHPPGAGKTLSALAWLAADDDRPNVIVTTSKARWQYGAEAKSKTTWEPIILEGETVDAFETVVGGETIRGRRLPTDPAYLVVCTWQILPFWLDALRKLKPRAVVFDESHSPGAKSHTRWKAVIGRTGKASFRKLNNISAKAMDLSRLPSVCRRLATSATPVRDRQRDHWAQLDLIEPKRWGTSYWTFAKSYCAAHEGDFGGMVDTGRSGSAELLERLNTVRHLVPLEVALKDLPPTRREVVRLYPDQQNKALGGFGKEFREARRHGAQAMLEARLAFAASRKREWIADRACEFLERGQKVIIFTGRRRDVGELARAVGKRMRRENRKGELEVSPDWLGRIRFNASAGKDVLMYATHGGHSDELRGAWAREYLERDEPTILIATIDAMGESLNLQRTDWMCFAMLPYTPGQIIQGEGRGRRLGQDRSMLISYVIAKRTIDEHVADILLDKLPAIEATVGDTQVTGLAEALEGIGDAETVLDRLIARMTKELEDEARLEG